MRGQPIEFIEPDPHPRLAELVRLIVTSQCGNHRASADVLEVDSQEWPALWAQLRKHRIGSLLGPLIRSGELRLPEDGRREVEQHARSIAMLRLRLNVALQRQLSVLDEVGIESRVLKGLATGPLDYRSEASRHTADVDLLVRPVDFDHACELIRSATHSELKPDYPAHLLVERTFRDENGLEIDLHHRLFRFGGKNVDVLFESSDELPSGHGLALSAEGRLVHAAAHLLIAPPGRARLSSLIDVAVLGGPGRADIEAATRLAARFGVEDLVAFAIWLSRSIGATDHELAPKPSGLIGRAYLRTRRSVPLETVAVLSDLDGVRNKLDYARFQIRRER